MISPAIAMDYHFLFDLLSAVHLSFRLHSCPKKEFYLITDLTEFVVTLYSLKLAHIYRSRLLLGIPDWHLRLRTIQTLGVYVLPYTVTALGKHFKKQFKIQTLITKIIAISSTVFLKKSVTFSKD